MNINYFKTKLEEERLELERQLSEIAKLDPDNPEDWKSSREDLNIMPADKNELADIFEEAENRNALERELEDRLSEVKDALQRIEDGTYGKCEGGCDIETKRLEANPAATTCIKHANPL